MTGDYCYICKCNPLIISYNPEHVVLIAPMFHTGGGKQEWGRGKGGAYRGNVGINNHINYKVTYLTDVE